MAHKSKGAKGNQKGADWRADFAQWLQQPPTTAAEFTTCCRSLTDFGQAVFQASVQRQSNRFPEHVKEKALTLTGQLLRFVMTDLVRSRPLLTHDDAALAFALPNLSVQTYGATASTAFSAEYVMENARYLSTCGFPSVMCDFMYFAFHNVPVGLKEGRFLATFVNTMKDMIVLPEIMRRFVEHGWCDFAHQIFNQASANPAWLQHSVIDALLQGVAEGMFRAVTLCANDDGRLPVLPSVIKALIASMLRIMAVFPATRPAAPVREANSEMAFHRLMLVALCTFNVIDGLTSDNARHFVPVLLRSAWVGSQAVIGEHEELRAESEYTLAKVIGRHSDPYIQPYVVAFLRDNDVALAAMMRQRILHPGAFDVDADPVTAGLTFALTLDLSAGAMRILKSPSMLDYFLDPQRKSTEAAAFFNIVQFIVSHDDVLQLVSERGKTRQLLVAYFSRFTRQTIYVPSLCQILSTLYGKHLDLAPLWECAPIWNAVACYGAEEGLPIGPYTVLYVKDEDARFTLFMMAFAASHAEGRALFRRLKMWPMFMRVFGNHKHFSSELVSTYGLAVIVGLLLEDNDAHSLDATATKETARIVVELISTTMTNSKYGLGAAQWLYAFCLLDPRKLLLEQLVPMLPVMDKLIVLAMAWPLLRLSRPAVKGKQVPISDEYQVALERTCLGLAFLHENLWWLQDEVHADVRKALHTLSRIWRPFAKMCTDLEDDGSTCFRVTREAAVRTLDFMARLGVNSVSSADDITISSARFFE